MKSQRVFCGILFDFHNPFWLYSSKYNNSHKLRLSIAPASPPPQTHIDTCTRSDFWHPSWYLSITPAAGQAHTLVSGERLKRPEKFSCCAPQPTVMASHGFASPSQIPLAFGLTAFFYLSSEWSPKGLSMEGGEANVHHSIFYAWNLH